MARTRRTYTPEFKAEAVKLVTERGCSLAEAARSLGLRDNLIRNWKQALEAQGEHAFPGHIEQQEFEYTRHGTVNLLLFLVVHTGQMQLTVLEANDTAHYIPALRDFRRRHRRLKGVFLIHDGGASHIAQATVAYVKGCAGW